jgi:membrane protein
VSPTVDAPGAEQLVQARRRLDFIRRSWPGRFVARLLADDVPRLAVYLAWGSLNTLLPLLIAVSGFASLILRDPTVAAQLTTAVVQFLPGASADLVQTAVDNARRTGGTAGLIGLGLLLYNGSNFFANVESVVNLVYRVESRNFVRQRILALSVLLLASVFLTLSTFVVAVGGMVDSASEFALGLVPFDLASHADLIGTLDSVVPLLVVFVGFLLLYRTLPNCPLSWRHALPGALASGALFFLILKLFPLYLQLFGVGFEVYAVFGTFLLLMFWTYLLGIVIVFGAELNAFIDPGSASPRGLGVQGSGFRVGSAHPGSGTPDAPAPHGDRTLNPDS